MTDEVIRAEPGLAQLSDTTLDVRRLIRASQELTIRTARRMGASVNDMTAVLLLSEHGPLGVAELARRLGMSSPAATVLVTRLERDGMVARAPDRADRRRVRVRITPAGQVAVSEAWVPAIRAIDEVDRELSGAERVAAQRLLQRLTEVMSHQSG